MEPLVSIVIPTYNRARDLERALKSVLTQTYSHWEALIVDNHSNDNTDELVHSLNDPRLRLIKIHNNGVIAASRNLGIKHALGEYIAFLDSDDWWTPKKLGKSVKYLGQGADVVYHNLYVAKKSSQRLFLRTVGTRDLTVPVAHDLITHGNALANSGVVIKKTLLLKIGLISEDMAMNPWSDFDAWLKVAKHTEKFVRVPGTLGYYWKGGGNTTSPQTTLSVIERFRFLYADALKTQDMEQFYWINYAMGQAHYRLESYGMAEQSLRLIRWPKAPLPVYLKSQLFRMLGRMHGFRHKSAAA
jgi:glycosyltransferase involved in cell wall biosynthesis